MNDSMMDTIKHIRDVQALLWEICAYLAERGRAHDMSKLYEPEKTGFDTLSTKLSTLRYGSDEYKAALDEGRATIEHHYQANQHHPEHWPNGISDMSLIDIIEMFCDWTAASNRTADGSLEQSLVINKERFGIDEQLAAIFENTRRELMW